MTINTDLIKKLLPQKGKQNQDYNEGDVACSDNITLHCIDTLNIQPFASEMKTFKAI